MHATQPPTTPTSGALRLLGIGQPGQPVDVTLTGPPAAVVTAARTIARVLPVRGMQHTRIPVKSGSTPKIQLTITCEIPAARS